MTHKFSRAQRRADRARLKVKRQFHWGYGHKNNWGREVARGEICFMDPSVAGTVVNTPTPCSCWMCGNPRHTLSNGSPLTRQEQKADDSFNDGLEDYQDWLDYCYWDYFDDYDDWRLDDEYQKWKWRKARGWSS